MKAFLALTLDETFSRKRYRLFTSTSSILSSRLVRNFSCSFWMRRYFLTSSFPSSVRVVPPPDLPRPYARKGLLGKIAHGIDGIPGRLVAHAYKFGGLVDGTAFIYLFQQRYAVAPQEIHVGLFERQASCNLDPFFCSSPKKVRDSFLTYRQCGPVRPHTVKSAIHLRIAHKIALFAP